MAVFLDTDDKTDPLWIKALEGFVILLSRDVDIIFVSESVSKYLGISQVKTLINIYNVPINMIIGVS